MEAFMRSSTAQSSLDRSEFWSDHISRWKKSGLSKAEYCRRHGLAKHSFLYWFKKLEQAQAAKPEVVPLSFPVQTSVPEHQAALSVKVGSRFVVAIQGDFHPPVLKKLIKTLEAMS
jgi:hypothetical protein